MSDRRPKGRPLGPAAWGVAVACLFSLALSVAPLWEALLPTPPPGRGLAPTRASLWECAAAAWEGDGPGPVSEQNRAVTASAAVVCGFAGLAGASLAGGVGRAAGA